MELTETEINVRRNGKRELQAKTKKGNPRCQETTHGHSYISSVTQCVNTGKYLEEPRWKESGGPFWYCKMHAPSVKQAKNEAKNEAYKNHRRYQQRQRDDKTDRQEQLIGLMTTLDVARELDTEYPGDAATILIIIKTAVDVFRGDQTAVEAVRKCL